MSRKAEYEAAYFTLLRAREELEQLQRYAEYLEEELQRIAEFLRAVNHAADVVPRKIRRPVDGTAKQLLEALGRRRAVILAERDAVPARIEAQQAFVTELEGELAALR